MVSISPQYLLSSPSSQVVYSPPTYSATNNVLQSDRNLRFTPNPASQQQQPYPSNNDEQDDRPWIIKLLKTWLPFINEAANVLTHSKIPIFANLYPDKQAPHKLLIDALALGSIMWNVSEETDDKQQISHGMWKGLNLLTFSFLVPNYVIGPFVEFMAKRKFAGGIMDKPIGRLASGMAMIALLEGCVHLWDEFLTPMLEHAYHKTKNFLGSFRGQASSGQ